MVRCCAPHSEGVESHHGLRAERHRAATGGGVENLARRIGQREESRSVAIQGIVCANVMLRKALMALTPNDRDIIDNFRCLLADRFVSDYHRTTTPADRAILADARRKARAIVGADAEYVAAVFDAERCAMRQTGQIVG